MLHKNAWESEGLYRKLTGVITGEEVLESNLELQKKSWF